MTILDNCVLEIVTSRIYLFVRRIIKRGKLVLLLARKQNTFFMLYNLEPEPSLLIEELQNQQINKWAALTLTVKVKNSATKPKIVWKKDGRTVGMGRVRVTYDKGVATLKIMRAENNDAGVYTVEIESGLEKCQSSATVEITGKLTISR